MKQKIASFILFTALGLLGSLIFFSPVHGEQTCDDAGTTGQISDGNNGCICPPGQGPKNPTPAQKCVIANPAPGQLVNFDNVDDLIVRIVQVLLSIAGAVAVIFVVIGGFRYITSRGNEEATEAAKKTVTNAVLGIVIIVMAFAIVTIVNNLLTRVPA